MVPYRLLALITLGILCYPVTLFLFPMTSPAARWSVAIDRDTAIARAREAASRFGPDVEGWGSMVIARYNRRVEYYISKQPDAPASRLLTPVSVSVKFYNYGTRRSFYVELNSRGEVVEFGPRNPKSRRPSDDSDDDEEDDSNRRGSGEDSETDRSPSGTAAHATDQGGAGAGSKNELELAETALKQIFGSIAPPALSDRGASKEGRRFTRTVSDHLLNLTAEVLVSDSSVKSISIDTNFTSQFQSQYDRRRGRAMSILSGANDIVGWPMTILVIIFYFTGLALKRIMHRSTLIFLGILFLFVFFVNAFSSLADDVRREIRIGSSPGYYWVELLLPWGFFILANLMFAVALYFCWAAGLALAIRVPDRQSVGLELLLKGRIVTKPVMTGILAGLLSGGALSAIPYLVALSGIFPGMELDSDGMEDIFISRSHALASFATSDQFFIFALFSFAGPLVGAYIKRRPVARSLFFTVTFLALSGISAVYSSSPALISVTLLKTLLLTSIYYRYGLLAVVACSIASQASLDSAVLLAQSSASLQHSGWSILIGLGIFFLVTLVGLWRAREISEEEVAVPPGMLVTRSERERLKAEFDVARRAQQQMLPAAPPEIEGLDIAAVCQPSREVGGDLYDFIPLSEGKLAIVVADVSGKGVPASLYMTLTKGLLDSVLDDVSDPGEALREVNRHLYEVCRRKLFVTVFLGIIDPARQTLVYARAGHNPTIYRDASGQTTLVLKSPGMGLGLNNGKIFDTSLKVETLQLKPDDMLLFYSDGITEAMNGRNEEYGEERLMAIAAGVDGMRAADACNLVMADVKRFLGSVQPQDDQTLVIVRVK